MTDMRAWLDRVTTGASVNAVAARIGMKQSTLDGSLRAVGGIKPEYVVKIARAYDADPVAALVELGLITTEEAGAEHDLTEADYLAWLADDERATDDLLLAEIGRRLDERGGGTVTEFPRQPKPAPAAPAVQKRAARRRQGKPKMGDE